MELEKSLNIILFSIVIVVLIFGFLSIKEDYSKKYDLLGNEISRLGSEVSKIDIETNTAGNGMLELFMASMNEESVKNFEEQQSKTVKNCDMNLKRGFISRNWYNKTESVYAHYLVLEYEKGYQIIDRFTGNTKCFDTNKKGTDCFNLCLNKEIVSGDIDTNVTDFKKVK